MTFDIASREMSAEEAAELIENGEILGVSGFTLAGYPKAVPKALARRAKKLHDGESLFKLRFFREPRQATNATGNWRGWRNPPESAIPVEQGLAKRNQPRRRFLHRYASRRNGKARSMRILAETDNSDSRSDRRLGRRQDSAVLVLRKFRRVSPGCGPNHRRVECRLRRFPLRNTRLLPVRTPPHASPIPVMRILDRGGKDYVQVPPQKIAAIVRTNRHDTIRPFAEPDETSTIIAGHILEFLDHERRKGRLPKGLPTRAASETLQMPFSRQWREIPSRNR